MKSRLLVFASVAAVIAAASATAAQAATPRYYLALGDSLSVGFQPNGHVGHETKQGYANDLYAHYKGQVKGLQLLQMGCPGETTGSMISGSGNAFYAQAFNCKVPHGSQLKDAVAFLKAHHKAGEVPLLTVDIGANDVDGCVHGTATQATECALAGVTQIKLDTPKILAALKQAAPKGTKLVAMNLYDPVLGYGIDPASAVYSLVPVSVSLVKAINTAIAAADAEAGFKTVDAAAAFDTYDTTPVTYDGQPVQANIAKICTLTWMCAASPLGPNIHANAKGYAVLATAFENVIGKL